MNSNLSILVNSTLAKKEDFTLLQLQNIFVQLSNDVAFFNLVFHKNT